MSDWQVGDLAVCVDDGERWSSDPTDLAQIQRGKTYRVSAVVCGGLGLHFDSIRCVKTNGYWEDRFRKVAPDKHEQCEPEFVTLLQRIKRKQDA